MTLEDALKLIGNTLITVIYDENDLKREIEKAEELAVKEETKNGNAK